MAALAAVAAPVNVVRRLIVILFAGQSFASLGTTAAITIGSIAAAQLVGVAAAGIPTTLYLLGAAMGAYPAGRIMERYGRRAGLVLGFLIGIVGFALSAYALIAAAALALFTAYGIMGLARGALDQGRYAAGDLVTVEHRARAISWVVLGGIVGGVGGPILIGPASRWAAGFGIDPLAGPYLIGMGIFAVASVFTFTLLRPDPARIARELARSATAARGIELAAPRTFRQVLRELNVRTAVAAMALGQVVMSTVMVMTPLHMTEHLHDSLDEVALVIAAHVTGMYATSLISGRVADRIGHARTIVIGAALLIFACVLAPFALDPVRLALALFVLGAGWNFCFVAGSSLLTDSLRPNERARIQGTNDLLVGVIAATGSLGGGLAFATVGYVGIAIAGITLALTLFVIAIWSTRRVAQARAG